MLRSAFAVISLRNLRYGLMRVRRRVLRKGITEQWVSTGQEHMYFFKPENRPEPTEESAASLAWRELTEHMREKNLNGK